MPGNRIKRARLEAGQAEASYKLIAEARARILVWLPNLCDRLLELSNGVQVQVATAEGPKVYSRPPDYRAITYLMDRVMGKPPTEEAPTAERLNTARSVFIEQQVLADLPSAQKQELIARAERAAMETAMWPQQFVTEEEEQSNLQAIAAAANRPLLTMTPEEFAEIIAGRDPAAALEELKGRLGTRQADIITEVMQYKAEGIVEGEEEDG